MPSGVEWPCNPEGDPLSFLCQIDFSEIEHKLPELPEKGILSVFIDQVSPPYMGGVEDKDYWRLLLLDAESELLEMPIPPSEQDIIKSFSLEFALELSLPHHLDDCFKTIFPTFVRALDRESYPFELSDRYYDFLTELYDEPIHRLLGFPQVRQSDIRYDYWYKKDDDTFENIAESRLNDVEFFLQITDDSEADYNIYDCAYVYVLNDCKSLKEKDPDNCWLVIQSA